MTSEDPKIQLCACRKLADVEVCGDGIDNDCDGKVDDCRTCNGVLVPNDDPKNCGACGNVCSSKQSCHDGRCVCPSEAPTACSTGCTDVASDAANCGACGANCGPGSTCKAGACQCTGADTPDYCAGAGCVSLAKNANNCGRCGNVCGDAQVCKDGACACPSTEAPDYCPNVGCVDQKTNHANCGGCGKACLDTQTCVDGVCSCPKGQTLCGDACVDMQTNASNCGACGTTCGATQICWAGSCGCATFGQTVCGSECVALLSDPNNCGQCGTVCGNNAYCSNGTCACTSGLSCNGVCIASSDNFNCGSCGNACPSGQSCAYGVCTCAASGLSACGSSCVNLLNDTAHCGACDKACRAGENCSGGSCTCPVGQMYCDAAAACFNLAIDPKHCGACDKACNSWEICNTGSCTCPSGQTSCNAAAACVNLSNDPKHCGACDKECGIGQICSAGSCKCSTSGQSFCATSNACVSLASDNKNCGACDVQCPAETHCTASACRCDQSGLSLCGSTCYDLQNDEANCGACGNACGTKQVCTTGRCQCPDPTPGVAVRVTSNTSDDSLPTAVWDGTHVAVAYHRTDNSVDNVRLALLNPDGTVVSDTAVTNLTGTSSCAYEAVALAFSGTEYGIVWTQRTASYSTSDLMFLRVGTDGMPKAPAVRFDTGTGSRSSSAVGNAWSSSYGGFALSYVRAGVPNQVAFRRIGTDGLAPEAENLFTIADLYLHRLPIAAAPTGGWAIAGQDYSAGVSLALIDADGARTAPVRMLNTVSYPDGTTTGGPWLVHDGHDWLTTFVQVNAHGVNTIYVSRGSTANSPSPLFPDSSTIANRDAALAMVSGTLAVGFTKAPPSSSAGATFTLQRFAIPIGSSSALTSIHGAVDILGTQNIAQVGDIQLVATGDNSMLAIWADNRWGAARELYARPIDLNSCP